jgi:tripartite-type tricarboxylate transporter receptor subunit TctC
MNHRASAPGPRRKAGALSPVLALLLAACGGGGDDGSRASGGQTSAVGGSCYDGRTATFVVPYSPGGGYDTVARALAPALQKELGGTIVVQNQPGAGGLTAANKLYEAEPDGLTFAILPSVGILAASLADVEGVNFDPLEFTFVARVTPDERLMVTGPDSGLETIDDVLDADRTIRFAATGPGGGDYIDATIVSRILGIDGEVVSGYPGSGDTALAVTSGDVDAVFSSVAGLLAGVENNDLIPVMVAGEERAQDLPDVPAMLELDLDDEHRALANAHGQLQQAGRAIIAPPDVPQNCVDQLSAALESAVDDQQVVETLEPSHEHVSYLPGEELEDIYTSVLEDSPDEYVTLVKGAFEGQ